jgi:hypothetical protein
MSQPNLPMFAIFHLIFSDFENYDKLKKQALVGAFRNTDCMAYLIVFIIMKVLSEKVIKRKNYYMDHVWFCYQLDKNMTLECLDLLDNHGFLRYFLIAEMVREQKIKVQFSDRIIEYQLPN